MHICDSISQKSENEMLQAKVVEKNEFYFHYLPPPPPENPALYVEKYGRARQATDYNIIRRMCFECRITKSTDSYCISTVTNGYANVSESYVHLHCLSFLIQPLFSRLVISGGHVNFL